MNKRSIGTAIAVIGSLFLSLFSCTPVDDTVGSGFIPDAQMMRTKLDTITGINAFLAHHDSFPMSNLVYGYIGATKDAMFGVTRAGTAFQYLWLTGFPDSEIHFGTRPVVDSMVVYLNLASFSGDTSVLQTFNLYELTERIYKDTTYFADRDMSNSFDPGRPLATFTHKGGAPISLSLTGPNAEDLMRRLVDTTGGAYRSDSVFLNTFRGFYITPATGSPDDASIVTIDLTYSYFMLHVRNFTDYTASEVSDTLSIEYTFENVSSDSGSPLGGFGLIEHDYAETNIRRLNDTLQTSTPVELGYIQGLGGVVTYLRFTTDFVRELKSKIVAPYTNMVVNRAELQVQVNDPTTVVLNKAFTRLGSYSTYMPLFIGIADYRFYLETYEYGSYTLPYGGYLNRSTNMYQMNIASFVQSMVNSSEIRPYTYTLGPSSDELYDFSQVQIRTGTGAANPHRMQVALTYTLVK